MNIAKAISASATTIAGSQSTSVSRQPASDIAPARGAAAAGPSVRQARPPRDRDAHQPHAVDQAGAGQAEADSGGGEPVGAVGEDADEAEEHGCGGAERIGQHRRLRTCTRSRRLSDRRGLCGAVARQPGPHRQRPQRGRARPAALSARRQPTRSATSAVPTRPTKPPKTSDEVYAPIAHPRRGPRTAPSRTARRPPAGPASADPAWRAAAAAMPRFGARPSNAVGTTISAGGGDHHACRGRSRSDSGPCTQPPRATPAPPR